MYWGAIAHLWLELLSELNNIAVQVRPIDVIPRRHRGQPWCDGVPARRATAGVVHPRLAGIAVRDCTNTQRKSAFSALLASVAQVFVGTTQPL